MAKPFAFRALSPHHATPMDLGYLLRVIDAARKYGFNAIQICGDTHGEGNLDGITEFVRFPKANDVMEREHVRRIRQILRDACRAAHDAGMEVYYWHHELWYPNRLADVYPDWFVPAPENRFRRDLGVYKGLVPRVEPGAPIWEFMDAKFDEAFEQCPELDGTVMTIQEARVPIYCLFEDFEQQVAALVDQYKRLESAHNRVGKSWILRTFAWREHEYRVVTEAINRFRPTVPVESKGVPMDWSLYYCYDPLLAKFEGMTKHIEIAPSCEFHGATLHPVGHPWFYTENLRFAAERGHTGLAVRMDRAGQTMLGSPDEGVLACIGKWAADPEGTDLGVTFLEWLQKRYGLDTAGGRELFWDVMENCWNATLRCYHEGKIYIGDAFWLRYDRLFFIGERHFCVEYDGPSPLAEKDTAVELADRAAAAVDALKARLKPEDYADLKRRVRFLQLTCRSYRALLAALVARQRQMYEPSDANKAALEKAVDDLEAAGAATDAEFPEPGEKPNGQRQPGRLVVEFAQAFRKDLPNLPGREIISRLTAATLGARTRFHGESVHQPGPAPETVTLQGKPGRPHVLVVFAGTEMCVLRPLVLRSGAWTHRLDIGQYAWFLAHDRVRRYEVPVPAECIGPDGACTIELSVPEPENAPYLRELRLETETPARA